MVFEADLANATRVRLPVKLGYQIRNGTIDASCVVRASEVRAATITPYRTKGPNFKRLKVVLADGETYVVDALTNVFDYTSLNPAGVIRGSDCQVSDGILEVENARFRSVETSIEVGNRQRAQAHLSWRTGINYVSQLEAIEGHAERPGFSFKLIAGGTIATTYRMRLIADGLFYAIEYIDGPQVNIEAFNKVQSDIDFFTTNPPLVRLADGSQLSGEILLKPREELIEVFDHNLIEQHNWGDTLLNQESRWSGGELRPRSIQQKFIEYLNQGDAAFIIDDDDAGESADVVAIEDAPDTVTITLWHCKYSSGLTPGNRVKDLYEVCGQAQKSVKWTWNFANLVAHITERETKHRGGRQTRFVKGHLDKLIVLKKAARRKFVVFKVGIVQPGLSKTGIENEHLAILGATSLFLRTVTNHPLMVISS